jgi:hypothetical protein
MSAWFPQTITYFRDQVFAGVFYYDSGTEFRHKFHFKFWKPINAIGGKIYFGPYVEIRYVIPRTEYKEIQ